jgi:hypothetical protein
VTTNDDDVIVVEELRANGVRPNHSFAPRQ